jgi:hypothetical protein
MMNTRRSQHFNKTEHRAFSFKNVFFEVKTSLGAPHTFYSRGVSFMRHAKIIRITVKSFASR